MEIQRFLTAYPPRSDAPGLGDRPPSFDEAIERATLGIVRERAEILAAVPPPTVVRRFQALLALFRGDLRSPEELSRFLRPIPVLPDLTRDPVVQFFRSSAAWYAEVWGGLLDGLLGSGERPASDEFREFLQGHYVAWLSSLDGELISQNQLTRGVIHDYLVAVDPETVPDTAPDPVLRTTQSGERVERTVAEAGTPVSELSDAVVRESRRMAGLLQGARFHMVQRFWQIAWAGALNPRGQGAGNVRQRTVRTRVGVARQAVDLAELREFVLRLQAHGHEAAAPLLAQLVGTLAELDAAVVLCEFMERHEGERIFVFPAPPGYERRAGRANSDFLLVDLKRSHALGIQVKATNRSYRHTDPGYDPRRVVMLYSAEDLNGFNWSGDQAIPWPGSVSLRYLSTARYDDIVRHHLSPGQFREYKDRATALLPSAVSPLGRQSQELARLAARARAATPARPARGISAEARTRELKQLERQRFDRAVDEVHERLLAALYA